MNAPVPASQTQATAQAFLARYDLLKANLPGDASLRDAAAAAFARTGLPGAREEDWRYTQLRPLAELALQYAQRYQQSRG